MDFIGVKLKREAYYTVKVRLVMSILEFRFHCFSPLHFTYNVRSFLTVGGDNTVI